ncbi:juvenile hormone esterase-like [Helicoverpa armigera]|uniref:juvenile hormone esterase-like n=1 Tax=Helicoverpa armigera TaxID=29058 RepID=UPI0030828A11
MLIDHTMLNNRDLVLFIVFYTFCAGATNPSADGLRCEVRAFIDSGWLCGLRLPGEYDKEYASFRGIPYAQQPVGALRFKELQPVRPWPLHLDATQEGPICPQHDELYARMVQPQVGMSESCIYANVHVPMEALPVVEGVHDHDYHVHHLNNRTKKGVPILVFIHGGGFQSGSGDTDLQGPEYLVSKGIMVVTFNYRINVFGFLSLNSPIIPGNVGLRDQVTLLRWVQRNARAFGGDPDDVTLAGQSAGSACAHLLSLSKVTKGLFKRVILMSGTAIPAFFTASPIYSTFAATRFLSILGINSTDPDVIHDQLINTPLEDIVNANSQFQYETGLVSFSPVVEGVYPGVERIIDDDPIRLIKQGRGKEYPLIVGFANAECEFFKKRLLYLRMIRRIEANPLLVLPVRIPFSTAPNVALELAQKVIHRYFHGKLNIDDYLEVCRDTFFSYPAFKVVEWRAEMDAAPAFLYKFSYESLFSAVKAGVNLNYHRTAHVEDLTYIFRENAILGDEKSFPPKNQDDLMKDWMTDFFVNFMRCGKPTCGFRGWLSVRANVLNYQAIDKPAVLENTIPTKYEHDMIEFFDKIEQIARNASLNVLLDPVTTPT